MGFCSPKHYEVRLGQNSEWCCRSDCHQPDGPCSFNLAGDLWAALPRMTNESLRANLRTLAPFITNILVEGYRNREGRIHIIDDLARQQIVFGYGASCSSSSAVAANYFPLFGIYSYSHRRSCSEILTSRMCSNCPNRRRW